MLLFVAIIAYQWHVRRRVSQHKNLPIRNSLLIPTYIWILWAFGFTILYAGRPCDNCNIIMIPRSGDDDCDEG